MITPHTGSVEIGLCSLFTPPCAMLIQGFLVVFLVEYELHDVDHSIFSA